METEKTESTFTPVASAERASPSELEYQRNLISMEEMASLLMQAMPGYAMVVNCQRQIVAVNQAMSDLTGKTCSGGLLGLRPGEALNCSHSSDSPGGCGTGENCQVCGAVLALMQSQQSNELASHECRVILNDGQMLTMEFIASAAPIHFKGEHFTLFTLKDISDEKRRNVLEQTFFHDVLNTAGGIHGLANLLLEKKEVSGDTDKEYINWLVEISGNLVDEIQHQRRLMLAERGEFKPQLSEIYLADVLKDVHRLYSNHERTPGRELILSGLSDCTLKTDPTVLRRIIGNLVINALEATPPGGTVTVSSIRYKNMVYINIHNSGVISQEVQLQLFMRSFSTKSASGRGVGTYSAKLFGETYLNGKVSFTSSAPEGTIFTIALPCNP